MTTTIILWNRHSDFQAFVRFFVQRLNSCYSEYDFKFYLNVDSSRQIISLSIAEVISGDFEYHTHRNFTVTRNTSEAMMFFGGWITKLQQDGVI